MNSLSPPNPPWQRYAHASNLTDRLDTPRSSASARARSSSTRNARRSRFAQLQQHLRRCATGSKLLSAWDRGAPSCRPSGAKDPTASRLLLSGKGRKCECKPACLVATGPAAALDAGGWCSPRQPNLTQTAAERLSCISSLFAHKLNTSDA